MTITYGGNIYIYIFPRNVRHHAKSMLQNQIQNLPRQMRGTRRLQPATSIQNPVPLRKRYHRGTQRAEGRGCGKDFPRSRAVAFVRAGACGLLSRVVACVLCSSRRASVLGVLTGRLFLWRGHCVGVCAVFWRRNPVTVGAVGYKWPQTWEDGRRSSRDRSRPGRDVRLPADGRGRSMIARCYHVRYYTRGEV